MIAMPAPNITCMSRNIGSRLRCAARSKRSIAA
jgi:hypothetical protein